MKYLYLVYILQSALMASDTETTILHHSGAESASNWSAVQVNGHCFQLDLGMGLLEFWNERVLLAVSAAHKTVCNKWWHVHVFTEVPCLSVWWQNSSSSITGATQWGQGCIESSAWLMPAAIFKHVIPFLKHCETKYPWYIQLLLEFPPPPSPPRSWCPPFSSVWPEQFADLKTDYS